MSNNKGRGLGWGSNLASPTSGYARTGRAGHSGRSGRGGRGGRGGSQHKYRPQNVPNISLHPLGELLATLDNSFLDSAALCRSESPTITDCHYVTSYNWLNEANPTIVAPGKPPLWTPLDVPRRLKEDDGEYFRDPNAARFPEYPTEPAVRALLNTDASYPMSSIDVFACGSTMGNILRFVRRVDKPFRFSVEAVNNTVFFIRKENSPGELIDGIHGYGHTFPENYTTWEKEVKGSETHQRVVHYRFGGFKCLVRYECDGHLGGSTAIDSTGNDRSASESDKDDIANVLRSVSITPFVSEKAGLTLKTGGSVVSQESIFDLKTRSRKYGKAIDMEDQLPALWVKQISNFVVAYHDGAGYFEKDKVQVHNVRDDIQQWEADNRVALKRMAAVMRKIVDYAKANDDHRIDVYCPSVGRLELRKQMEDEDHVLPLSLRNLWTAEDFSSFGTATKHDSDDNREEEFDDVNRDDYQPRNKGTLAARNASGDNDRVISLQAVSLKIILGKYSSGQEEKLDYTACTAEACGYCGGCCHK